METLDALNPSRQVAEECRRSFICSRNDVCWGEDDRGRELRPLNETFSDYGFTRDGIFQVVEKLESPLGVRCELDD